MKNMKNIKKWREGIISSGVEYFKDEIKYNKML